MGSKSQEGGFSIGKLLDVFISSRNARSSKELRTVQDFCNKLFARDYTFKIIDNTDGSYCSSYPLDLIILQKQKSATEPALNNINDLSEHFLRGRFARVRGRFPIPVIIWNKKNICRSSTISIQAEVLLNLSREKIMDTFFTANTNSNRGNEISYAVEAQRKCDLTVLNKLRIKYICDLMVEKHKMKMGVVCSSSEKAERNLYTAFQIQPMPYPGCEFFRDFKENKHNGLDLKFNWNCSYIDAKLKEPEAPRLDLNWGDYKSWDIVLLTQNYFRLIMEYITDSAVGSGVLVHCISGWDRTPLFISLLRLSLWADGEIHQSLNAKEILFLTLGYDWMLFSHLLDDRLAKGEDIFYFCFYMLPFIANPEFSTISMKKEDRRCSRESSSKAKSDFPPSDAKFRSNDPKSPASKSPASSSPIAKTLNESADITLDGKLVGVQENHFISSNEPCPPPPPSTTKKVGFTLNETPSPPPRKVGFNVTEKIDFKPRLEPSRDTPKLWEGMSDILEKARTREGGDEGVGFPETKSAPTTPSGSRHERMSETEAKVLVGSWQFVSADLQGSSPTQTTPKLTAIVPSPPVLSPPLLRKSLLDLGDVEDERIDEEEKLEEGRKEPGGKPVSEDLVDPDSSSAWGMDKSFTAKMLPSYTGSVVNVTQLTSPVIAEDVIAEDIIAEDVKKSVTQTQQTDSIDDTKPNVAEDEVNKVTLKKTAVAQSAPSVFAVQEEVEKPMEDQYDNHNGFQQAREAQENTQKRQEARKSNCNTQSTLSLSGKLSRREQRLKMVHDLFMIAYRDRILGNPSTSPRVGILRWVSSSLF